MTGGVEGQALGPPGHAPQVGAGPHLVKEGWSAQCSAPLVVPQQTGSTNVKFLVK